MILVFGGTTEGRRTASVLEEAAKSYFYSTRGAEQEVELLHGRRLVGAMDCEQILAFSREHDIRLIIDAAHPFATELHRNLIRVAASQLQIPLLRYDRQPAAPSPAVIWCEDYADALRQLEQRGVGRLLALTGVQTIAPLRPFWQHHDCWFRILDREDSRSIAREAGFPQERLIQVPDETLRPEAASAASASLATLLRQLQPQAILTKESGSSGGFQQKVTTAQAAGVPVFVVRRPAYPPACPELSAVRLEVVYGPHGLRRQVERLVPGFFSLRTGLTTGTCATAAVKAALLSLQGEVCESVWVQLPDGERLVVDVQQENPGRASVIKDFSDDPDVTRGCRITAQVEL
nr:precorrin-6A/cobalt-precorrin-6A reductase [Bacteroidaceae bacterium]